MAVDFPVFDREQPAALFVATGPRAPALPCDKARFGAIRNSSVSENDCLWCLHVNAAG